MDTMENRAGAAPYTCQHVTASHGLHAFRSEEHTMSNYSNSNAHDSSKPRGESKQSTALGPPNGDSEGESWEMRRTVADERRQHLLRSLGEHDGPLSVTELAELVAGFRTSGDRECPTPVAIERERTRLCRVDLPQLHDAGYVVYDADESEVSLPESPNREFTSVQADDD